MRRNQLLSLLIICIALIPACLFQSCATANLNDKANSNNIIVRLYIGLSSNINQEEIEIEDIENILGKHFDGATLQEAIGLYKGEREKSLIITIANCCRWEKPKDQFRKSVNNLVLELRRELGQESILVEYSSYGETHIFEILE